MVRSTVDYYTFTVRPRRKDPHIPRGVIDLGDGHSILSYLCGFLEYQKGRILRDERKQRIYSVKGYEIHGRLILIDLLSGQYGEESHVMDILNGRIVTDISTEQAAVRNLRIVFCCPKADGIPHAIFAVEHVDSINGYYLIDQFAKCMRRQFDDSFMPIKAILEKEAWLESSNLHEMSIKIGSSDQQVTLDNGLDDEPKETLFGQMVLTIKPAKGFSFFNPRFWKLMLKPTLERAGILTIPALSDEKIDKYDVSVTAVGADKRQKRFTIGNEKYPKIRELLTDYGVPRLDNGAIRRTLAESIFDKYRDEQIHLERGWDDGPLRETIISVNDIDWGKLMRAQVEEGDEDEALE